MEDYSSRKKIENVNDIATASVEIIDFLDEKIKEGIASGEINKSLIQDFFMMTKSLDSTIATDIKQKKALGLTNDFDISKYRESHYE